MFKSGDNDGVTWLEIYDIDHINLPFDLEQLPDIIISLYKGNEKSSARTAFYRTSAASLLQKGVENDPSWYELCHDTSKNNKPTGYPGTILLRIALAPSDDVTTLADWDAERKKLQVKKTYYLRVMVYQCRDLPAIDDNGLIDPYCKVRFNGKKLKTKAQQKTRNPCFYECLTFETKLSSDLRLAPNLLIELWDENDYGKSNILVSSLHLPITGNDAQFMNYSKYIHVHIFNFTICQ